MSDVQYGVQYSDRRGRRCTLPCDDRPDAIETAEYFRDRGADNVTIVSREWAPEHPTGPEDTAACGYCGDVLPPGSFHAASLRDPSQWVCDTHAQIEAEAQMLGRLNELPAMIAADTKTGTITLRLFSDEDGLRFDLDARGIKEEGVPALLLAVAARLPETAAGWRNLDHARSGDSGE